MNTEYTPPRERTFPLQLAPEFVWCFKTTLRRLQHLLERLGREATLAVWQQAFLEDEDALLEDILSGGWRPVDAVRSDSVDVEAQIAEALSASFSHPWGGVSAEEARRLVEDSLPFRHIRERFASLHVAKELPAYEALHLTRHGLASLVEALIDRHGKQGELTAYDAMLYPTIWGCQPQIDARAFLDTFRTPPPPDTLLGAGLALDITPVSETEVRIDVAECEFARYYRERHPRVGYLMACSMDYASYRALHPAVRMQRTTTLMEGGKRCDFGIYLVDEPE